jgi:peroxiredoxin Q/BCP
MKITEILGLVKHVGRKFLTGIKTHPLDEGARAPDFTANDESGKEHRLSQYLGRRVVLWFYLRASTPG